MNNACRQNVTMRFIFDLASHSDTSQPSPSRVARSVADETLLLSEYVAYNSPPHQKAVSDPFPSEDLGQAALGS